MNIEKNILEVPIEDIIPNRFQPRLAFNEEGINDLAESIKQHGIIQPLVVRKLGDKYEIIAGERRYKASTMAGLSKVPVIISDIDDNKSAEVALVENIQRRNLTAIEEAKSYKNLLDRGYLTQEQLANKMGVSQSTIANKLRLLNLDEEVQDALLNEKISERHARALLTLEDKEDQKKWLKRILDERLTVRQLDIELKKLKENGEEDAGIPLVQINPNLDEIISHAEDINVEREAHDVASMLIPEAGLIEEQKEPVEETKVEPEPIKTPNKFFNFLEEEPAMMDVIEPEDILNTFTAPKDLDVPQQEEKKPVESTTEIEPNKEAIEPMENTPSLEDLLNQTPVIEEEKTTKAEAPKETSKVDNLEILEVLDDLNTTIEESIIPSLEETKEEIAPIIPEIKEDFNFTEPTIEPIVPETVEPVLPQEEPVKPLVIEETTIENNNNNENNQILEELPVEPVIEEPQEELTPFKSIFFPSEDEEETTPENLSSQIEIPNVTNNTIEEIQPVIEEPLVDPLDSIVTLEPGYEQKQEELAGTDLKTAINMVRDTVSDLERRGFVVDCEEADLEDIYHITIKIDKNNK